MEDTRTESEEQPEYQYLDSTHPFTQWLRTYLLWAHILGVEPQVFAYPPDSARAVHDGLRWQGQNLWVEQSLLERIPPRLLAILAVHRYVEEEVWRRYLPVPWLLGALAAAFSVAVAAYLQRVFGANLLWHLVHLFVLPLLLDLPSLLREYARLRADEETQQRLAEPEMFFQALETAIVESYRNGDTERYLRRSLKRLNRLRARRGEPALTLEQVKARAGVLQRHEEEQTFAKMNSASQEE
ncbi:MAG: hypothetical protein RMK92_08665 [Armatimonadota bacterium]|nr:hypothetical protein [Armatimonadota bacterium]